jgi:hypothetical protein
VAGAASYSRLAARARPPLCRAYERGPRVVSISYAANRIFASLARHARRRVEVEDG